MKTTALALLLAAAAMTTPAEAALLNFDVRIADGAGGFSPAFGFQLDDMPAPDSFEDSPGFAFFQLNDVALVPAAGTTMLPSSPKNLQFFTEITGGAFGSSDFLINYFGLQLFSGPVTAPRFLPGTYDLYVPTGEVGATLTIAAVPEPATWAMFVTGFGILGGMMRRPSRASPVLSRSTA